MSSVWKKYAGKILRRCNLCGKFSARYRQEDAQLGVIYICLTCWNRRQSKPAPKLEPPDAKK
jgi:hypothetical protein